MLRACLAASLLLPSLALGADVTRLDGTPISREQIDAVVTRSKQQAPIPGIGIALFNKGVVVHMKAYGERDRANGKPLTPDSIMTAASLTEPAFAVLVLQLVEQRVLNLDRPIVQYLPKPLPQYPSYTDLASDRRYERITQGRGQIARPPAPGTSRRRRLDADHAA